MNSLKKYHADITPSHTDLSKAQITQMVNIWYLKILLSYQSENINEASCLYVGPLYDFQQLMNNRFIVTIGTVMVRLLSVTGHCVFSYLQVVLIYSHNKNFTIWIRLIYNDSEGSDEASLLCEGPLYVFSYIQVVCDL